MCITSRERGGDERKRKTTTQHFLKHAFEVLVGLVKERLHDQVCVQYLKSVHRFVSRSGFVAGVYTSYHKIYVTEGSFSHDRPEFSN